MPEADTSHGYEALAGRFLEGRGQDVSGVGASVVSAWAQELSHGASVLDLGCGSGVPITLALVDRGCAVYAVDASPTLVQAFRLRFPAVPVECAPAENSAFFARSFDGIVAWGLLFLLEEEVQRRLLAKMASALASGGRLLFTAPRQRCTWQDAMTGQPSHSLGAKAYRQMLHAAGLLTLETQEDAGGNHYYLASKP